MAAVASDAYYVVSADNYDEVRGNDYNYLYNSNFSYLKSEMIEKLTKYREDMRGLSGQAITNYEKIDSGVYRTTFEDGSTVTVNYNNKAKTVNSVTYDAESYTVVRQEG
jgi:hypothetical protein